MRRGEILALKWKFIDFTNNVIFIKLAWKMKNEIGQPKWNKERIVPIPQITYNSLQQLKSESIRIAPDDLVFCYDDSSRFGGTWWIKRFKRAMEKAGIDKKSRNLKPHSFRHTLNTLLRNA